MTKHSPTPWKLGERHSHYVQIDSAEKDNETWTHLAQVCVIVDGSPDPTGEANAALIVEAVNAHHELLEALELAAMRFAVCSKRDKAFSSEIAMYETEIRSTLAKHKRPS